MLLILHYVGSFPLIVNRLILGMNFVCFEFLLFAFQCPFYPRQLTVVPLHQHFEIFFAFLIMCL